MSLRLAGGNSPARRRPFRRELSKSSHSHTIPRDAETRPTQNDYLRIGRDENSFQAALNSWYTITEDIEKKYVGRMNVHGYQGSSGPRYALQQAARKIGQGVWDSEYGDEDASGDTLLQKLMRDLQLLQPTAWVHWQAIDGSGWGLIKDDINIKMRRINTSSWRI